MRVPSFANAGNSEVTITIAALSDLSCFRSSTPTPKRSITRCCAMTAAGALSPVPGKPDHEAGADQHVAARTLNLAQIAHANAPCGRGHERRDHTRRAQKPYPRSALPCLVSLERWRTSPVPS